MSCPVHHNHTEEFGRLSDEENETGRRSSTPSKHSDPFDSTETGSQESSEWTATTNGDGERRSSGTSKRKKQPTSVFEDALGKIGCEGWLRRKKSYFSSWRSAWFVVSGGALHEKKVPDGAIVTTLDTTTLEAHDTESITGKKNSIGLFGQTKGGRKVTLHLRAANEHEYSQWMGALRTQCKPMTDENWTMDNNFEMVHDAVVVSNKEGTIVTVNNHAARLFGCKSRKDLIGRPLSVLMPHRVASVHDRYMRRYNPERPRLLGKKRTMSALRADGTEFVCELSLGSMVNNGQTYFLATIRDVENTNTNDDGEIGETKQKMSTQVNSYLDGAMDVLTRDVMKRLSETKNELHTHLSSTIEKSANAMVKVELLETRVHQQKRMVHASTRVAELASLYFTTDNCSVVRKAIRSEVKRTDMVQTLFRQDSSASRLVMAFLASELSGLIQDKLTWLLTSIERVSTELVFVADCYMAMSDSNMNVREVRKSMNQLFQITERVFDAIVTDCDFNFPANVTSVLDELCREVSLKWGTGDRSRRIAGSGSGSSGKDSGGRGSSGSGSGSGEGRTKHEYSIVGGFVFLRLFNPAIVNPVTHGLVTDEPEEHTKRNLVNITRYLQHIANGTRPSVKPIDVALEPDDRQELEDFFERVNEAILSKTAKFHEAVDRCVQGGRD